MSTQTAFAFSSFKDSFERKTSPYWFWQMPDNYSCSFSDQYKVDGRYSLRVELREDDVNLYGSKRAELSCRPVGNLDERTYSVSILLPKGGDEDYALDPVGSEIITQWHNAPDPGEEWTTPPLALRTFNGRYILERYWDDAPMSTTEQMKAKGYHAIHDLGPYEPDKGRFVNWTFHIKWGWEKSQHPFIEVYKDGVRVLNLIDKPNTTNDRVGVNLKIGIYKWDWAQSNNTSILQKRVIYYDKVIIR